MAPVLKTGEAFRVSVGSNPTPSAQQAASPAGAQAEKRSRSGLSTGHAPSVVFEITV